MTDDLDPHRYGQTPLSPPRNLTHADVVAILDLAYRDAHRLVDVLAASDGDDQAIHAVAEAFAVEPWAAQIIVDQQLRHLTAGRARQRAEELRRSS